MEANVKTSVSDLVRFKRADDVGVFAKMNGNSLNSSNLGNQINH